MNDDKESKATSLTVLSFILLAIGLLFISLSKVPGPGSGFGGLEIIIYPTIFLGILFFSICALCISLLEGLKGLTYINTAMLVVVVGSVAFFILKGNMRRDKLRNHYKSKESAKVITEILYQYIEMDSSKVVKDTLTQEIFSSEGLGEYFQETLYIEGLGQYCKSIKKCNSLDIEIKGDKFYDSLDREIQFKYVKDSDTFERIKLDPSETVIKVCIPSLKKYINGGCYCTKEISFCGYSNY